ncbi:MAG: type transporter [Thermoleophilia bacterium]|jgi:ABC transporter DrrB family efflux protein|nr:type transporter [Thermoleophilia bacterium]
MNRFLADTSVMAWRNLRRTLRLPEMVVFATIQPVMFVVLFRYVFGGAIDTGDTSYVNFLMAGIFVQTIAFGSFGTALGLVEDLQRGVIDRFRSLPMKHGAVVLGRIINDISINLISIIVMVVVGVLVGFRPEGSPLELLLAFALMLLISFSFSWIGATIGLTLRTVEAVNSGGFLWMFPLTFVSSAFVPVESMPEWLQGFAEYQPFTRMVDAVRALSLGLPARADVIASVLWCLAIIAVFVPVSMMQFRKAAARS